MSKTKGKVHNSHKFDKYDIRRLVKKETEAANIISVGITWVDGRCVLKPTKRQALGYYGICHYSRGIWAITPIDYEKPLGMTEIKVSPTEDYCEKAHMCLNLNCPMNKYNRSVFVAEFAGAGGFSLGIPHPYIGAWFNEGEWKDFWGRLILEPMGGTMKYDPEKDTRELD
ncbi:MAG: hypothetical protein ACFFCQ_08555 [Promethearchaeota archaeon]